MSSSPEASSGDVALSTRAARRRLLWLTNIAAPYRLPVWNELAGRYELTVAVFAESERWRERCPMNGDVAFMWALGHGRQLRMPRSELAVYLPVHLRALFKRIQPEAVVVTSWESPANWEAARLAGRHGVPLLVHYGTTPGSHRFTRGPVNELRKRFLLRADAVIAYGSATSAELVRMGLPDSRIFEALNTVDVESFHQRATAVRARQVANQSNHNYLFVGRLLRRKNVESLLHAFASIRRPGDCLRIVGDGPERARLERVASALDLGTSVLFHGHQGDDRLVEIYATAHTLVLPSTAEVWGLVANEALASGLHVVISTACGAAPDLAHMRGVYQSEPDAASLAGAMSASRDEWRGPISSPEVAHAMTPASMARAISTAIETALRGQQGFGAVKMGLKAAAHT